MTSYRVKLLQWSFVLNGFWSYSCIRNKFRQPTKLQTLNTDEANYTN